MDRKGFKNRLKQYKKAREENPGLKYWEWKDIPKYDEGGEVEEPGLWDKFTNTVSVLYNNAARKVKNFFEEEAAGEVIDLSNQQVTRVTPDTKNLTAIYGNEFVENNANNIRTRKQFEETADTLIGDRQIPLSQISNFYGIENGKLKAGDLSTFDENTVVIPNRAKKTGKIKEIIFTEPLSEHKIDSLRRVNRLEQSAYHVRLKEFADSLGMDYGSNKFTLLFYGSPYSNLLNRYREAIRNDSDQEFVKKYNELKKLSPRLIEALNQLRHGNISYVTESNDTIRMANTSMPALTKTMYADELGNSLFINNTKNLSKEQQDYVNEKLKVTPMYPILIDNGRYQHYQTDFPNYHTYTSFDFARDPKNMYVIGALGFAEGGQVEPDPLDVLERSRPKVAGIPINDKPLSGTDPLGELYLNLVSGNAVRKAVANGVNGMIRKSFYNNYKELLKAGWNRQRAYDYASPELAIDALSGITKGFDYTLKGANYTHAIEDFVK